MGVYIPNMEKPKSCKECESFCIEFYMGENKMGSACTLNDDDGSTIEADYNSCPLIEIDEKYVRFKDITHIFFYHFRTADEKTKAMLNRMFEQIQGIPMVGERSK